MSTAVEYDFELFHLERNSGGSWVSVNAHMNSFAYQEGYNPDAKGTLIYQSETATVNMSYWFKPGGAAPLYPRDTIRAWYGASATSSTIFFQGIVTDTSWTYTVDPKAINHGSTHRVDFTATMAGKYESMMEDIICHKFLPAEKWIHRMEVTLGITVDNWTRGR